MLTFGKKSGMFLLGFSTHLFRVLTMGEVEEC